jgi:pimeloyl-ACP methyl ester carboxylesterase
MNVRALMWGLLIILMAGSAVAVWFRSDLSDAHRRLEGRSRIIRTSLADFEYAELGSGPPVLVSHGSAGGFDHGLEMAASLASAGYRLIAPSRAGYLGSAIPDSFSPARQADLYAQLLDQLKIRKVSLLAISAGDWSALAFAQAYPDRCQSLILLVPANRLPDGTRIHGGWVAEAILKSDFAAWLAIRINDAAPQLLSEVLLGTKASVLQTATPSEKQRIHDLLKHLLPLSRRWAGMQFDIATAASPPSIAFGEITCPVLAISTDDDSFNTLEMAREIVQGVADGRLVEFPTGGHALVGRNDEVFRKVTQFLDASNKGTAVE